MNTIFPVRLKALRKDKEKTQEDMSKLLNIQRSTYGEYERGKIVPPMDKIKILADFFGVSVDYLMGNTNIATHKERNEKDPLDLSRTMKQMLEYLHDNQSALTFDGKLLNDDSREVLISSLENTLKTAQMINKRKD